MPKKVVIASTNPVKIEAVRLGFSQVFPDESFIYESVKAESGVPAQPLGDDETLRGAKNRVRHARTLSSGADFYVGLEGGAEDVQNELREFAWIVVASRDGKNGKGKTCTLVAPAIFRKMVLEDKKEIGDVCDIVFGESNSKQKMGAFGILTRGIIDRTEQYRHGVVLALVPFIHNELY